MKRSRSLSKTRTTILASAISAVVAGYVVPAFAAEPSIEEITVTGSRIMRRDLTAPSPIVTVGIEQFENSATTGAESVLNQMPQFIPGATQFSSSIQSTAASSPGAATLNLRGLGSNRNLVLIDGRRGQPANASLTIDINTIPSSAIANVEVITGGASAVYGADAMAGVVNFVLKNNFEGFEADFQTGRTAEGDGDENKLSLLMGLNSANGKGNIMMGLDVMRRQAVMQLDRDFYRNGWLDPTNPGSGFVNARSIGSGEAQIPGGVNRPSQAAVDKLFPQVAAGKIGSSTQIFFNDDGSPFVVAGSLGYNGPLNCLSNCGAFTGVKKLANGNLDQFFTGGYASTPLDRHSFFAKGEYHFNDNITGYLQATYSNVAVTQRGGLPPAVTVWQAPIPRDGRTLPAALNSLLDSRANPAGYWSLYQVLDYNGPIQPENTSNVWQMTSGLKGKLGFKDWTFDAFLSHGSTRIIAETYAQPSLEQYQFLVAKPNFGQGNGLTAPAGTGQSAYHIDCPSGLPVFKQFTPSDSCLAGIEDLTRQITDLTQDIGEFDVQGSVMNLPAGEARFAAGVDYRQDTFRFDPSNPVDNVINNPIGIFASAGTKGKTSVREFYGELLLPVIKNLDLELGYRYSDYNTAGGVDTYKTLFTWKALDSVTFRGGYQFATRAPNTAELFTGPTQQVVGFPGTDPCSAATTNTWGNLPSNPNRLKVQSLCRAIIGNNTSGFDTQTYNAATYGVGPNGFTRQNPPFFPLEIEIQKGNPNVGVEKGKTYTLGAVITEPFGMKNLTVTADLYKIKITDAIAPESSFSVYSKCFNADGASNPTYDISNPSCQLISRNSSTGDRASVIALYSNLGVINTQGVDLQVNWKTDIGPGRLSINSTLNYLDKYEYQQSPTSALVNATGTLDQGGQFRFKALTSVSYNWSDFRVGMSWRYLSSIEDATKSVTPKTTILGVSDYSLFNLTAGWNYKKYAFRAGVDNLFDKQPPVVGANPGVDSNTDLTNPGFYDILGRRYYVGVKMSF